MNEIYFFILGRNPALSVAEILAVLAREQIDYKIGGYSCEVLLIETKEDLSRIFHQLGGSIKFGKIINSKPRAEELIKFLSPNGQKAYFGFSFYKLDDRVEESDLRQKQRELQKLAMEIKKTLRASGHGARFVTSRERALSSVVVKTNKLLNQGAEFVFFIPPSPRFHGPNHGTVESFAEGILIGKTLAVQEFEEYQLRDYGRPRRDILRGMLPPKIAKMMINLAQAPPEATILDPFCGEGTILTEAAILGYKNLIGTDVDPQAVADAKINLDWIKKFYLARKEVEPRRTLQAPMVIGVERRRFDLEIVDVREFSKHFSKDSVDAIVTEPFLGPLLRGGESVEIIQKIKTELEELYKKAFLNFNKILKSGSRVVFIFPVWRLKQDPHSRTISAELYGTSLNPPPFRGGGQRRGSEKYIFIDLEKVLPREFKIQKLLPENFRSHEISTRSGIIWQRPDQKVLREIIVLKLET